MFDYQSAKFNLAHLYQAATEIPGWDRNQTNTFIEVGEYSLALDEIAHAYLDGGLMMPPELYAIFENLVVAMGLGSDPELLVIAGVKKLQDDGR